MMIVVSRCTDGSIYTDSILSCTSILDLDLAVAEADPPLAAENRAYLWTVPSIL